MSRCAIAPYRAKPRREHDLLAVQQLWGRMMECAQFPPWATLAEAQQPFASFETIGA